MTVRPFDVIGELFAANTSEGRIFVNQGGTSSGKTYTIMQVLLYTAIMESGCVITVAGQDLPNLKVGAMRDTKTIVKNSEWLQKFFTFNESESYLKGINGSIIEFKSYANEQDAKSGKRDYLFINEANGIPYIVYWQLQIRTRKKVWIDYNPTSRFWAHDEVIGREGVKLIISDHRGNPFLTQEEHDRIEYIEDKELWDVYARGLTGKVQGLILRKWDIVNELPPKEEWKMSSYGLDFGFTNDQTALEHVVLAHGDIWIDEIIYSTGLTNPDIASKAIASGITKRDLIIADSAEPKSIAELRNLGLWVNASVKGKDSIIIGLDILRRYTIHVTRRSEGIISNLKSYKWKKDRDGIDTNNPEDCNNHGIDAVRYVALSRLNIQRRGTAKAKILRQ